VHIDCSSLVAEGIVGLGVNDILKNILRKTNYNVKEAEIAVVLLDEIDKLLASHYGDSVLYQLLRITEGGDIPLIKDKGDSDEFRRIHSFSTENILFIFAGSFQEAIDEKDTKSGFIKDKSSGNIDVIDIEKTKLPKELLGRIGDIATMKKLTRPDYKEILLDSPNSPVLKYNELLAINDNKYELSEAEVEEILDEAEKSVYGARSLDKIVKKHFDTLLHNVNQTIGEPQ
jgi:ATP-dependent Clp protease ATP-binding subunit ClpX